MRIAIALFSVFASAAPALAQKDLCNVGQVAFDTAKGRQVLTLEIHEGKIEVAKGLYRKTELAPSTGVLAIYDAPRSARELANSNVMAADIASFDQDGQIQALLVDATGPKPDYLATPDGMVYAAYLAGGTLQAHGFDASSRLIAWVCTEPK
ncbi:MAG: hypothetical protein AAFY38_00285 [Pseudomonadota bacterium]